MAGTPRTIQLLLLDGDARGRIKCSLTNWTGVAYLIPRTELPRCKDMAILNQTGVYLLFGKDEETRDDQVYVGQARSPRTAMESWGASPSTWAGRRCRTGPTPSF